MGGKERREVLRDDTHGDTIASLSHRDYISVVGPTYDLVGSYTASSSRCKLSPPSPLWFMSIIRESHASRTHAPDGSTRIYSRVVD